MNLTIEKFHTRLVSWSKRHPTLRQWAWLIALWLGGLGAVTIFTYPLKMLMRFMAKS